MHTLYDVKTDIPSFFVITNGDVHDSKVMPEIPMSKVLYISLIEGIWTQEASA